jgi:hypothetical protein
MLTNSHTWCREHARGPARAKRGAMENPELVRDRLAACDAALLAVEAALADPLAEIDEPARRAYEAARALAATNETSIQCTAARMLEVFEPFVVTGSRCQRSAPCRS